MNFNKILLAGNLTRDPEVRFLANEKAVATFGLAVNRRFKNAAGETVEEVTFVDIECWGKTAEQVGQYLTKGKGAFIEGRLKQESWEDKATGAKRSKLMVVADLIQFTGAPSGERRASSGPNAPVETNLGPDVPHSAPVARGNDEPPF
jgi:single-strand DNA-binding protein